MNFDRSPEQQALLDSLQRWLDRHYSFTQRKAVMGSAPGCSDEAWATYAEMGLLALTLPEADGGLGAGLTELGDVMQLLGAALALEPLLPTVLAASLLAELGTPAQRERWLPAVADGRTRLALAHGEPGQRHARTRVACRARRDGAQWVLNGHKAVVVGAPQAQLLLVSAREDGDVDAATGLGLFVVDPAAPGVQLRAYGQHDGQRAAEVLLADVRVDDAARLAGEGAPADTTAVARALGRALDRGAAAVCAEAVGVMQAMNDTTLEYLKTRKQFGVAIGSFQALQHRMADMVVAQGQAASMALLATVKADSADAAEREATVSAAKAYIGEQARFVGQQAIQLHGGMGITDEMKVSHLFRRLTLIEQAFGDTDHHLDRFSRSLLTV